MGIELRQYQQTALSNLRDRLCKGSRRPLLVSPTGCHAHGQLILTYAGIPRRVEDIQIGDELMGPDFRPRMVLNLCHGRGQLVRVAPSQGPFFTVNEDHVLTLVRDGGDDDIVDVSVREWLRWSSHEKGLYKLFRVATRPGCLAPSIVSRSDFSINSAGKGEFFGFTLDGDGRYLLDDFTVTHNSGKTVTSAALVHSAIEKGSRVLFVAHRKEIIDQTSAKLDAYSVPHGIVQGHHWRQAPELPVQVASIQTLVRREQIPANLIIIDEAHHAKAKSYGKIIEAYPNAPVVGLTATPWRSDGKGLGDIFDSVVVAATPAELIESGHLVRFDGFSYEIPNLDGVGLKGGDYDESKLELACNQARIVGGIVEQWLAHANGARAIVFAVSVAHSQRIVQSFRDAGVVAEHLDGTTPMGEREAVLARFANGITRVLSNVGVLTEGWDCPAAACCILARPTKSLTLYLQMVGRVLRPHPESGKERALIHDHAGCLLEHGLPDEPRDYSLSAEAKQKREQAPSAIQCPPPCGRIYPPSLPNCPECGKENLRIAKVEEKDRREREVAEIQAQRKLAIEEIRVLRAVSLRTKASEYKRLLNVAERKGYKTGWAAHQFKATFDEWPRVIPMNVLVNVIPAARPVIDLRRLRNLDAISRGDQ